MSIQTLNGIIQNHSTVSCQLSLSSLHRRLNFTLPKVYVVDKIPVKPNTVRYEDLCEVTPLKDVEFNNLTSTCVSVLIGADIPELFCIKSFRKGPPGSPVAILFPIGWSLLGPSLSPSFTTNCNVNFVRMENCLWDRDFQTGASDFQPTRKQEVYSITKVEINENDNVAKLTSRCSSLLKLKRIIAWILRIKSYLTGKYNFTSNLTASELQAAENCLIKYVQLRHFPNLFTNSSNSLKLLPRSL